MAIVRFDPFGDLGQLQDRINRAFDAYGRGSGSGRSDEGLMTTGAWAPPVDIYQNADQELVLKAELPDISPEDIELNINNDTLTISGEKRLSKKSRKINTTVLSASTAVSAGRSRCRHRWMQRRSPPSTGMACSPYACRLAKRPSRARLRLMYVARAGQAVPEIVPASSRNKAF